MVTRIVQTSNGQISIHSDGTTSNTNEFICSPEEVPAAGSNTFATARNGDRLLVPKTGQVYVFDETDQTWYEI